MIIVNLDVMLAKRKMRSNELAEKIGLTQANLSILKTGKVKAVRLTTLDAICRELDISVLSYFAFRLKEIADILELRENTVAKYRSSIKKKAQIDSVEGLMEQVL